MKEIVSTNKCICPYCNRVFYIYPVHYAEDKIIVCDICKNKIKIKVSMEFTCTTIENVEQEQKPIIKENKENRDYAREAYLAGHRDAYASFSRHIY
jgi:hypothetical protein